ncbi:2'-5'-oligoadenylate synthase 2-like isoform X2 [Hemicordylus capensis]|nr:2'-5'-oligoadenylate synthase 2-like isoform X2 [Hemicordylus capensis]
MNVVKGGSLERGTALKGSSDADLVLFLDIFEDDVQDQERVQKEIIQQIGRRLKKWQELLDLDVSIELTKQENPRGFSIKLRSYNFTESMALNVVPAYNAMGQYNGDYTPDPQVYIKLKEASSHPGEFSNCFTELQKEFISQCPPQVKSLIRLVKYWFKKYICQYKSRLRKGESLPPKYALELLAVYAWQRGSHQTDFDMAEGFQTVLWLIEHYKELCIYWTTYYDFENETISRYLQGQLQKPRPVILDPADPTKNLGEGSRWDLVAEEAKCASQQKCFIHQLDYISPWNVPTFPKEDLYNTKPNKLDKFIFDFLQPNKEFLDKMNRAINSICAFFRDSCFTDASWSQFRQPRVLKVVKGGSLGKGTALKGSSDADMVLFLKSFEGYTDQKNTQTEIILKIKERLKEWQKQTPFDMSIDEKWNTPRSINFELSSSGFTESIKFDVLPAYDALGQYNGDYKPDPQVYIKLIKAGGSAGEFSRCFTELQRNFISRCDTKVKNLIRLVKYWYRKYKLRLRGKASLPPKYAMELLAVYAWERGSGNPNFDTAEGFRTVLWLIEHYKELCIFWTTYYDFENETIKQHLQEQLQKPRPVILDPADPTGNLGESGRWDLLAQEAKRVSCQKCFMRDQGYQVLPWDVPVHLSGLDGSVFSLPYISAMEDLYNTEPRKLDRFISMFLQPNKEFLDKMNEAVDRICTFFKNKCFTDPSGPQSQRLPRVPKVVKGGSLGKGTALKGSSDADLVLFLDIFKDYTDQKNTQSGIILEIKEKLKDWQDFDVFIQPTKRENPRVLSFELQSYDFTETIEFDVLPAYDAMGQISNTKPDPQVYVKLIEARGQPGEFSRCFTELQKTFISQRPTKVKSLIRLVKYWYKKYVLPCKSQLREGESLPPKYALELLAVYAWEKGSREPDFDMAEGFQTVLWLIENYKQLCIFWTKSYDFEDLAIKRYLQGQLLKRRPVILDPADPTGNLGEGARWDLLAQEAKSGSRQKCLKYQNVYISPWKVPLQVPWEDDRSYGTIVKQFLQGFF